MGLLHWEKRYSVGVEAVDYEHHELVDLKKPGRGVRKLRSFFGDLFKAISAHFALEDRIMRERGYDQLLQHKDDHERLLDEIRDIMEDYEVTDLLDEQLLSQRLDAWFSRHFETHDARLHHAFGHR